MAGRLVAALSAQTVTVQGERRIGESVADLARELKRLDTRRGRLVAPVKEVFQSHPLGPVLMTFPGVGPKEPSKDPRGDR